MNEEHEDEIDKMLYEYFEQHKPKVSASTRRAIATAFDKEKEKKHKKVHSFSTLSKVATVVITFTIFFSGISFAGDFWKVINLIFTNSNEAINKAVENGYVQKVDMDFVEDNDVGVKIDYILLDDKNLNISFVSQYKEQVDEISLNDIIITNEKGENVASIMESGLEDNMIEANITRTASQEKIDNNVLKESIHIVLNEHNFPISKQLFICVGKVSLKVEDKENVIQGNWNIIVNLDEKFSKREKIEYQVEENDIIVNSKIEIIDTSLNIEMDLKEKVIDKNKMTKSEFILIDKLGKKYYCKKCFVVDESKMLLFFDISKYELENNYILLLKLDNQKEEKIDLIKNIEP